MYTPGFRLLVCGLCLVVLGSLACGRRLVVGPALGMGLSVQPADRVAKAGPRAVDAKRSLVGSLRRTSCFGSCPVFSVEVWSDGQVLWLGEHHVARVGAHSARVSAVWIAELQKAAEKAGFFELASQYPRNGRLVPDLPQTITMLRRNGQEHRVINNADAPLALQRFERYWQDKLESLRWKPVAQ